MRGFRMKWLAPGAMMIALVLAGCGGGGSPTTMMPEPPEPMMCPDGQEPNSANDGCVDTAETMQMKALSAAREAAMTAATAADEAADAAEMAADDQMANMSADEANYALAQNAAMRARAASDAANAASDAAAATDDVAEAQKQQGIAEAQKMTAETEQANAAKYAGMVADAHQANLDEIQRQMDVADARTAAMGSYEAAAADAMKAEAQAEAAEATAPGSAGAMAARAAATAARAAADAAKAAHDAITDGMTKADADAKATEAATEAATANTQYMAAKEENDTIQTAAVIGDEQRRMQAVADARTYGGMAVDNAKMAADDALAAANAAKTASNAANAAYMQAMSGRTDATEAKKQADAAQEAYMAAKMASDAANAAYMAAKAAIDGVMDDSTLEEANAARMTADTEAGKAATSKTTAMMKQTDAEGARDMAMASRGTHVLSLFLAANGAHVMDLESTMNMDEKADHVADVGEAMAMAAVAAAGAQAGTDTAASAAWPAFSTVDDPATEADESVVGTLSISVNPAGAGAIPFELGATRAADDTATPPVTARIQTAKEIAGLGVFRGFDIWEDDGMAAAGTALHTGDGARVIAFTNKTQDDPAVAQAAAVTARDVTNLAVTGGAVTKLGTKSGNMYTGAEFTPTGEGAMTGTLTCPAGEPCSVTTADDGTHTVTGYVFTGSREAKDEVTVMTAEQQATANNDYLVFGLWLDEGDDGTGDTFGAFAFGGPDYAANVLEAITGTATYSGKAAGAHHKTGDGVNWFDGDASLTANFGPASGDGAAGTISGAISNIRVAGGAAMSAPIYLGEADLTAGEATFNGAAFMGAATAPGASTHEFDGTWSGSFFGASAAVEDDPTTTEDETVVAGTLAPAAAAGTFGVTKSMGTGDDAIIESFVGAFGAHKD